MLDHEVDRLLARPAEGVHARCRPRRPARQASYDSMPMRSRSLCRGPSRREALRVEAPALHVRGRAEHPPERRQVRAAPGRPRSAGGARARPRGRPAPRPRSAAASRRVEVDVVATGPRAVHRRPRSTRSSGGDLGVARDRDHDARRRGPDRTSRRSRPAHGRASASRSRTPRRRCRSGGAGHRAARLGSMEVRVPGRACRGRRTPRRCARSRRARPWISRGEIERGVDPDGRGGASAPPGRWTRPGRSSGRATGRMSCRAPGGTAGTRDRDLESLRGRRRKRSRVRSDQRSRRVSAGGAESFHSSRARPQAVEHVEDALDGLRTAASRPGRLARFPQVVGTARSRAAGDHRLPVSGRPDRLVSTSMRLMSGRRGIDRPGVHPGSKSSGVAGGLVDQHLARDALHRRQATGSGPPLPRRRCRAIGSGARPRSGDGSSKPIVERRSPMTVAQQGGSRGSRPRTAVRSPERIPRRGRCDVVMATEGSRVRGERAPGSAGPGSGRRAPRPTTWTPSLSDAGPSGTACTCPPPKRSVRRPSPARGRIPRPDRPATPRRRPADRAVLEDERAAAVARPNAGPSSRIFA